MAALSGTLLPQGGGKLRRSLTARRGAARRLAQWAASSRDSSRPLIWFHAPSVGEGLMARPVIERIRQGRPDAQVAYTFFSPSAESFAAALPVDVADYLPFDTRAAARTVLTALAPKVLVFSKLDVWPVLVEEAVASGVAVALTSATVGRDSGRTSPLARLLLGDAYAALDAAGAVSTDDASRLAMIGVRPDRISVTGDVRYDQVWSQVKGPSRHADLLATLASARPTLVAGSTWPSDEAVLLPAWAEIRQRAASARLIIAAHEPSAAHTASLTRWAASGGLSAARLDEASADTDVVVVDRMGVLADLYASGTVAYVGGGFHGKGLHSVVEPAAHGAPVLFGPGGATNRDAAALAASGGGAQVSDVLDLARWVSGWFTDPGARNLASAAARQVVVDGLGAAERSAALVARLLAR